MSKTIRQYKHYPNSTELGQGNTHETYFLISKSFDLSTMFPIGVAVGVYDLSTLKRYELKSVSGREFRLNQLGEIYRDYGVMPGDEIVLTSVEVKGESIVYLVVNTFNRIVFDCTNKGVEVLNRERLDELNSIGSSVCTVNLDEPRTTLEIQYIGKKKKREDSPNETDFYEVYMDKEPLPKGKYFLTLGERNILVEAPKNALNLIEDDGYSKTQNNANNSRQTIFFGTPGSGKSYTVKDRTKDKKAYRTTFHPDSDYASFVGCYKPTMFQQRRQILTGNKLKQKLQEYLEDGVSYPVHRFAAAYPEIGDLPSSTRKEWLKSLGSTESMDTEIPKAVSCANEIHKTLISPEISYSFIPQVFTNAYVDAWTHLEEEIYLVIEEINRGNCAQIFGDLFQLLDRNESGYSDYRIKADSDLREYLYSQLGEDNEGIQGGELCLPPNLHIFATMNTSDQSLFPMDSAFKRRWDWEYVPVDYSDSVPSSRFIITLGSKKYRWVKFLQAVNTRIRKATDSEDKQMGNFFIKSDVSEAEFKSKVMFYLWNEVCRDEYGTQNNFFRSKQNGEEFEFSFNDLYQADGLDRLHGFMDYLGVEYTTDEQEPKDPNQEA